MIIRPARGLSLLASLGVLLAAGVCRAAPCPSSPPAAVEERRALARDWFREGEAAERLKDDLAAIRAYRCSMKMVPHAFTAYNLAQVAEHAGDLELAVEGLRQYLGLRPDADDRPAIEQRMQLLDARIAAARDAAPADRTVADPPPAPPEAAPAPVSAPPPVAEPPPQVQTAPPAPSSSSGLSTGAWVIAGAGTLALVAGTTANIMARHQMSDCRALAAAEEVPAARQACQRAKPYAYGSYALLGAAGVAAVVDLALWWRQGRRELTVAALPGGLAVALGERF